MDSLRAMRVFVAVAEGGSLAAAARALDLAPAVVTRLVAELEESLGVRLINRTTRRLALTDVGEAYLQRARQIVIDVDDAAAEAGAAAVEARGHLRLLAPPALAVYQLAQHLPAFHRQHPQVTLEIVPGSVAGVDETCDLTLIVSRSRLEGDFVARRLARSEVVLCAAPDYLNRRGRPTHPSELAGHDAMLPPAGEYQRGFMMTRRDGQQEAFSVSRRPLFSTSHLDLMKTSALLGLGLAGLPSFVADQALAQGRLERVLPEWRLFSVDIWAAMPSRKHLPLRTRLMLEHLLAAFGGRDDDPWLGLPGHAVGSGDIAP